jgi:hypothetical protein
MAITIANAPGIIQSEIQRLDDEILENYGLFSRENIFYERLPGIPPK